MRSSLKYTLEKLGKIDRAVEIGQRVGNNAKEMLKYDIKELYLVDPYLPYEDNGQVTQEHQNIYRRRMFTQIAPFGERVRILNITSEQAASILPDKTFDYIYIDGDHHYENVMNDLKWWSAKVGERGYLAGHDFKKEFPEVMKAVIDYANENNMKIVLNSDSDWLLKRKGLRVVSWIYEQPFKPYKKMAETLEKSVRDLGYDCTIYPATKEDVGACELYNKLYIKNANRPTFIKKVLNNIKDDIVWMDLDCVMQKPLGDVLMDCDVAVTLRKIEDRNSQFMEKFKFINSGVMFFKNNGSAKRFCDLWQSNITGEDCDQDGLNNLLLKYSKLERYGEVVDVEEVKVKILPCEEYNFFYFPEDSSQARVLHYKGFSFRKENVYN